MSSIHFIALEAIQRFQNEGILIPHDLSICGYDDMSFSSRLSPPLTTVRRPHYEMGKVAAELLTSAINEPDSAPTTRSLVPSLTLRSTTAAPRDKIGRAHV